MRLVDAFFLDHGQDSNDGRRARLLEMESMADYDTLVENMAANQFYGEEYLSGQLGYSDNLIKNSNLPLAVILDRLEPRGVLELGCGGGDVIFLLSLFGERKLHGIDISEQILNQADESIRPNLHCGDLLDMKDEFVQAGLQFDAICGFDIWEHLHPAKLADYIAACLELAHESAVFFVIIPAFGRDRVFGEVFPLEFEENRPAFEKREPFPFILADSFDPPLPLAGHLIWAHTEWWEAQFTAQGLIRETRLERDFHKYLDRHLSPAQQCFYIFRRDNPASEARTKAGFTQTDCWKRWWDVLDGLRAFELRSGRTVVDQEYVWGTANHVARRVLAALQEAEAKQGLIGAVKRLVPAPLRKPLRKLLRRGGETL